MSDVKTRLWRVICNRMVLAVLFCLLAFAPFQAIAAPYAAFVIDARDGKVLHARNADTRLHPASLTKMMTLYIAFEAIKHGEISLDTKVKISKNAAAEPSSKLGLKAGQRIKLRYLIRATAVKSANDAATAIGEAIAGSEAAFARRMNRTAKALGMTRTTFKNMSGLTQAGHLSTARDMTKLGRHLFYDHPEYYNLFSRKTVDAGVKTVTHTNSRFLNSYRGADGIKTGYTRAAGFNLVASARRGNERIIVTVFGGRSVASRNAQVTKLMDLGFRRAPSRVRIRKPGKPRYNRPGPKSSPPETVAVASAQKPKFVPGTAGKTIRLQRAVKASPRPAPRPLADPPAELLVAMKSDIETAVELAEQSIKSEQASTPTAVSVAPVAVATAPAPRPAVLTTTAITSSPAAAQEPVVVTRLSTSGGRLWGVNVGSYASHHQAERVLLKTALTEMTTLDGALRKVVRRKTGFDANFVGMTKQTAALACRRLQARNITCKPLGPI